MTVRVVPIIVSLVGAAGASALAPGDSRLAIDASSELALQPVEGVAPAPLDAREPLPPRRPWQFDLDAIFWWPWDSNADATARNVLSANDVTLGDLLDDRETYVPQARFEAWNEMGWGIEFVATWHTFNNEGAPGSQGVVPLATLIDTELEWIYLDLSVGFRVLDSPPDSTGFGAAPVDLFTGIRYGDINIHHTAQSNGDTLEDSEDYFEPVFGVRSSISIRDDIWWMTRFDISGISGTDLTWMIDTGLEIDIAERINFLVGYRVQQVDFDEGSDADKFGLDGTFHGPYIGLNFGF